jgi:hypothetical protein
VGYLLWDSFSAGVSPRDHLYSVVFFLNACMREPRDDDCRSYSKSRELEPVALAAMISSKTNRLPRITFLLKDVAFFRALCTLRHAQKLYNDLKSMGANFSVVYQYGGEDNGFKLGPTDLGHVMELPESKRNKHFEDEAVRQHGMLIVGSFRYLADL